MSKWQIHQDRDKEDPSLRSYTITLNRGEPGWKTDSGYCGYGLPKKLAQWICDRLNESKKECPFEIYDGWWKKKTKTSREL